jgi:hypothetical protein
MKYRSNDHKDILSAAIIQILLLSREIVCIRLRKCITQLFLSILSGSISENGKVERSNVESSIFPPKVSCTLSTVVADRVPPATGEIYINPSPSKISSNVWLLRFANVKVRHCFFGTILLDDDLYTANRIQNTKLQFSRFQ